MYDEHQPQPNTFPLTAIEQYFEAVYMLRISKPGSLQESYWKKKVKDLDNKTDDLWF